MSDHEPVLDVFVPDQFHHEIDEHGAHRLFPAEMPPFTAADLRIDIDTIEPEHFLPSVTRAVTAHRLSLSDAKVVHTALTPDGFFGGTQWEYVIAYRSGIFALSLFLWYVHVPSRSCSVNVAGVCLSEDSPIFYPTFRLIAQQSALRDGAAA